MRRPLEQVQTRLEEMQTQLDDWRDVWQHLKLHNEVNVMQYLNYDKEHLTSDQQATIQHLTDLAQRDLLSWA